MLDLDSYVSKRKNHNLTIGIELEAFILDETTREPLNDRGLIDDIINNLSDDRISRDYYPYQGEIRTKPHTSPDACLRELLQLLETFGKALKDENLLLMLAPYILADINSNETPCGLHIHVASKDFKDKIFMECVALYAYPSLISLADLTKFKNRSYRILHSRHLGIPPFSTHPSELDREERNTGRWYDICINGITNNIKSVYTIETRMFDTPSSLDMLEFIIETTFNIFNHLNLESRDFRRLYKTFKEDANKLSSYEERIRITRENIGIPSLWGFNAVFYQDNFNVIKRIREKLGLGMPDIEFFEKYVMGDDKFVVYNL